ncbi:MarR family winged helix-turn-helix transcriptional regulator [Sulfurimonas sp.]|uniref:MarR family winged helix-turn-helix transcriptional regulator n=1 Tax=Sulfurimonas sp. TaxID=2022749 RepID=UPI003D0CC9EB
MKKNLVALSSRVVDNAHKLIVAELKKHGIEGVVPSHGSVLQLLYMKKEVTMKEVADFLHKTKPTVTVLVNKLETLGYLYREKSLSDNRITYIKLTKKGEELEPIFENVSTTLNKQVYENLSQEESEVVEKILAKVLKNFE